MLSKTKFLFLLILQSVFCFGQIPILNSYPSITNKVVYLDFDGQVVSGTAWNSGNTVNALPSTMNAANIITIWKRMSEDYKPFDVNITTDSTRFNNAPPNKRIRVVVTPTSAWYGSAGGVAYVGSFTWGGTPGTPCWVFENQLGYSAKNIAEAAAHEAGHTFTLRHQSTWTASTCSKTAEYNPGQGTGVTSWAPIMGVGYYKNVTTWYTGLSTTSCNVIQYDESTSGIGLTTTGFLNFLPDDVGNTFATAKILNLTSLNTADSGLISEPTDIDAFKFTICNNRYVSIAVKPWALDTTAYNGANLDIRFFLYNASNTVIAVDTSLSNLNTLVGLNLTSGTYYFTVDGGRSANYNDYGSLGRYYINIKATNPPSMANTILVNPNICAGQTTMLAYSSNGTPTQWQWMVAGPTTNSFSVPNPTLVFSAGVHTITLLATSSASPGCATTMTLNVSPPPSLSMSSTNNFLCPGTTLTLTVTGASSYTWMPGSFSGSTQIVSPSANTTYTIFGSSGTCSNSIVNTVTVSPNFTVSAVASSTEICFGQSMTITANGASNYTVNPGTITSNPAVVSPVFPTNYFITGEKNGCIKNTSLSVSVTPHFSIFLSASDTAVCAGDPATLTAVGAVNYTVNPGGLNGSMVVVNPNTTTNYTVTGDGNGACIEDTTITVAVKPCGVDGIVNQALASGIRIYPNPSYGELIIETQNANTKIEIINTVGQIMYLKEQAGKSTQLRTQEWTPGIYFVKLYTSGKNVYTEKLIIK